MAVFVTSETIYKLLQINNLWSTIKPNNESFFLLFAKEKYHYLKPYTKTQVHGTNSCLNLTFLIYTTVSRFHNFWEINGIYHRFNKREKTIFSSHVWEPAIFTNIHIFNWNDTMSYTDKPKIATEIFFLQEVKIYMFYVTLYKCQ